MSNSQQILEVDKQGRICLPKTLRSKNSKYYSYEKDRDGTIRLLPIVGVITNKQAYFWTDRWQKGEKEASEDIKKGKGKIISPDKIDDFFDSL
ncbi:MAG: hypothetical protein HQM15_05765 [Deltaproteobacteria bacterium]|nr:hypothetical protein [Deltaproteobacteria bacterium]